MRRIVFISYLFIFFAPIFTHASVVNKTATIRLTSGLINYWTFDGSDFDTFAADVVSGIDLTPLNYANTKDAKTVGRIGQGANCLGGNKNLNASTETNTSPPAGGFTTALWFKVTTNNGSTLFEWASTALRFDGVTPHKINYYVDNGSSGSATSVTSLDDGKWHFVVFTSTANAQNLYVDNVLEGTASETLDTTAGFFTICNLAGGSGGNVGAMDEIRVYNRILTAAERTALYNMGTPSKANSSRNTRITSGLLGLWSFDGADLLTNVTDRSGQGNNGSMSGFTSTSTAVTATKIGQGLLFDGANDKVVTNSDFIGVGAISISAWIKPASMNGSVRRIVTNGATDFSVEDVNSEIIFTSNAANARSAAGSLTLNKWTHVVVTRTAGGTANIYIDGVLSGGANQSSGSPIAGGSSVIIGNTSSGTTNLGFAGQMDDVRIYNRIITTAEINALYQMGNQAGNLNGSRNTRQTSGLVGQWSFDGPDMLTNVADASGQGNNGSMINFAATSSVVTPGKIGQALKFDGLDDYIQLPNNSTYNFSSTDNFTITAWVKSNINSTNQIVFSTMDVAGSGGYAFGKNTSGVLSMTVRSAVSASTVTANTTLSVNKWTQVAAVFTGPTTVTFYVNGASDGGGTFSVNLASVSSLRTIGDNLNSAARFNGSLDDIRVYNRALTSSEIQKLYTIGN